MYNAKKFNLTPDIDVNNELRLVYGPFEGEVDLVGYGIRSDTRYLMNYLSGEKTIDMSKLDFEDIFLLEKKKALKNNSCLDELVSRGYDLDTFVFSIKKQKDENVKISKNDYNNKISSVKENIFNLIENFQNKASSCKDVYILDENEYANHLKELYSLLEILK